MDFQGQKISELVSMVLLIITGFVSFTVGYTKEDFALFIKLFLAGTAITCAITVPDWPFYNKLELQWQPSINDKGSPPSSKAPTAALKKKR